MLTVQIGVGGTAAIPMLGGLAGAGIAFDTSGNIAVYSYGGGGAGGGLNEGFGFSLQGSNAETINDLSGVFYNASASGGFIVGGTIDGFTGPSDHGTVVGGGFTLGEDVGGSVIVGATYTSVSRSFNPFKALLNLFKKTGPCK
ncbi:hypothetical protein QN372_20665 [Undibacterium sp. RTI2.1]|nr:hypothetical protein [Undibacterium sp. RTI2.1]